MLFTSSNASELVRGAWCFDFPWCHCQQSSTICWAGYRKCGLWGKPELLHCRKHCIHSQLPVAPVLLLLLQFKVTGMMASPSAESRQLSCNYSCTRLGTTITHIAGWTQKHTSHQPRGWILVPTVCLGAARGKGSVKDLPFPVPHS